MCGSQRGLHIQCACYLLGGTDNRAVLSAGRDHFASCRSKRKILPNYFFAFHHFLGQHPIGLKDKFYRLREVLPCFFEGCTLGISTWQLLDERNVTLRPLLE